eukprot:Clim_evm56s142 gene=Clim_evmTU56s142
MNRVVIERTRGAQAARPRRSGPLTRNSELEKELKISKEKAKQLIDKVQKYEGQIADLMARNRQLEQQVLKQDRSYHMHNNEAERAKRDPLLEMGQTRQVRDSEFQQEPTEFHKEIERRERLHETQLSNLQKEMELREINRAQKESTIGELQERVGDLQTRIRRLETELSSTQNERDRIRSDLIKERKTVNVVDKRQYDDVLVKYERTVEGLRLLRQKYNHLKRRYGNQCARSSKLAESLGEHAKYVVQMEAKVKVYQSKAADFVDMSCQDALQVLGNIDNAQAQSEARQRLRCLLEMFQAQLRSQKIALEDTMLQSTKAHQDMARLAGYVASLERIRAEELTMWARMTTAVSSPVQQSLQKPALGSNVKSKQSNSCLNQTSLATKEGIPHQPSRIPLATKSVIANVHGFQKSTQTSHYIGGGGQVRKSVSFSNVTMVPS